MNSKAQPSKPIMTQPGHEEQMSPQPENFMRNYLAAGKLKGKKAVITGGDSGIGRSIAIGFAKEGADIAIVYLEEDEDAAITKQHVEAAGRQCVTIRGDIGSPDFCRHAIGNIGDKWSKIDILVNNAGEQHVQKDPEKISPEQIERTFRTNIFAMFYLTEAALPYMDRGSAIVNTASITAYHGNPALLDYSATKGAIVSFTRSLAASLVERGIRVNAVAPGPIWTPLITATFPREKLADFGKNTPMKRPGQPDEIAPSYIFLASDDASYMSGQTLHPNGGQVVGG